MLMILVYLVVALMVISLASTAIELILQVLGLLPENTEDTKGDN